MLTCLRFKDSKDAHAPFSSAVAKYVEPSVPTWTSNCTQHYRHITLLQTIPSNCTSMQHYTTQIKPICTFCAAQKEHEQQEEQEEDEKRAAQLCEKGEFDQ